MRGVLPLPPRARASWSGGARPAGTRESPAGGPPHAHPRLFPPTLRRFRARFAHKCLVLALVQQRRIELVPERGADGRVMLLARRAVGALEDMELLGEELLLLLPMEEVKEAAEEAAGWRM